MKKSAGRRSLAWSLAVALLLVQTEAYCAGKLAYGTRAGMQVTIVSMEGIDTGRAIIRTQHTKEDATQFCAEYRGAVTDKCIQDELARRLSDEVTGNCDTGIFSNFFGYRKQFLGPNTRDNRTDYLVKDLVSGEIANGSTASGYDVDLRIFKALCPQKAPFRFDPQTGIIVKPETPSVSTYLGNWYVQNRSACNDKPGQSAEMVAYTKDRMIAPELSCKVLQATSRGIATELDLLCNGEGQRGVRQKEVVQVVNGRLEVTYVANGRKSTDKYLRCP